MLRQQIYKEKMKVAFEQLPENAKVWVYQSSDKLSPEQVKIVEELAAVFLNQWESHGIPVQGSVDIINDLFIRIAAFTNEASMCGRAQDAQVRLAKELENELNVQLTNRMLVTFTIDGEERVFHMNDVPALIARGEVTDDTPFYNNIIQSKKEYSEKWKVRAADSWLNRYFQD